MDQLSAWVSGLPSAVLYAAFFTLGIVRGVGYYLAGASGGAVARRRGLPLPERGAELVQRHGARSVVLTYPFVGLAAATQVAAGVAGVHRLHFIAALALVGSLWAGLQTVVGVAAINLLALWT